jgi:ABC-2 type transport system ATP-binding protein
VSDAVIATRGLTKRYGPVLAVDGIDLDVRAGDVYGFLGANGSGKTTTVRILLGLVLATSGEAEVLGARMPRSAKRVLPQVGTLVEGPAAYPHLSGRANLALFDALGSARRGRRARVDDVLERVGLGLAGDRRVRGYSHGMRQRLGIAASLLREPQLLLLDEPTTGLDPAGMRDMRELVKRLAADGITILLSSHILAEVEELCNRVAIIRRGGIIYEGRLDELLASASGGYRLRTPDPEHARVVLLLHGGIEGVSVDGVELRFQADEAALAGATIALGRAGIGIIALTPQTTSLEELFLTMTGGESADAEAVA